METTLARKRLMPSTTFNQIGRETLKNIMLEDTNELVNDAITNTKVNKNNFVRLKSINKGMIKEILHQEDKSINEFLADRISEFKLSNNAASNSSDVKRLTKKKFERKRSFFIPFKKESAQNVNKHETLEEMHTPNSLGMFKTNTVVSSDKDAVEMPVITKLSKMFFNFGPKSGSRRELGKMKQVYDSCSMDEEDLLSDEYDDNNFYIHPDSTFSLVWNNVILLFTLYTVMFSPISLAFEVNEYFILSLMDFTLDLLFLMDLTFNFFTAFYNFEDELQKSLKKMAFNYLEGTFLFDLLSSFPFFIFSVLTGQNEEGGAASLGKYAKIFRLYKIAKLSKLPKALKALKINSIFSKIEISSKGTRLLKAFVGFIFLSHLFSCFWIYLGSSDGQSWSSDLDSLSPTALYLTSLYFNWTSMFTIGYGDIVPVSIEERTYSLFLLVIGVFVYSFAITSVGQVLSEVDPHRKQLDVKLNLLDKLASKHPMIDKLYAQVKRFLFYDAKMRRLRDFKFLNDLPLKLRNNLIHSMNKEIIADMRFFRKTNSDFICASVLQMKFNRVERGDIVIANREVLREVVLVKEGLLTVNLGDTYGRIVVMSINKREHFGEYIMDKGKESPVEVKCSSKFADILYLSMNSFQDLKQEFPKQISRILKVSANNFFSLIKKISKKTHKMDKTANKVLKERLRALKGCFEEPQTEIIGRKSTNKVSSGTNVLRKLISGSNQLLKHQKQGLKRKPNRKQLTHELSKHITTILGTDERAYKSFIHPQVVSLAQNFQVTTESMLERLDRVYSKVASKI